MIRLLFSGLGLLSLIASLTGAAAEEHTQKEHSAPPPAATAQSFVPSLILKDIDRLFQLQDATARGNVAAAKAQTGLLRDIGEALATQDSDHSPALAPAVAAYVLSGGDPRVAERLASMEGRRSGERRLLEAAVFFMRGDREAAAKLFSKIDPSRLPARIAGRVALVHALLEKDTAQQEHFARAIATMPGSLVEESALRRSALAYGEAHAASSFWRRLERYSRRFPNSLYAGAFWEEAVGLIVTWSMKDDAPSLDRLDLVLSPLTVAKRRTIYLALARQATTAGSERLADFGGRRLARLALAGSIEEQLGQLYTDLFALVSPEGDHALARLRSLRGNSFAPRERALLDAALALGQRIERPAVVTPAIGEASAAKSPLEDRGASLLKETHDLLQVSE